MDDEEGAWALTLGRYVAARLDGEKPDVHEYLDRLPLKYIDAFAEAVKAFDRMEAAEAQNEQP